MPRIPPVIDAPPSCSFALIRRPKTEKPRAKPTKLIAVDIFCSRLCVLILNSGCRFGCAGGSLLKQSGFVNLQRQEKARVSENPLN
jgi:hypothetical protein